MTETLAPYPLTADLSIPDPIGAAKWLQSYAEWKFMEQDKYAQMPPAIKNAFNVLINRAAPPSASDAETAKALLKDIMVFDGTLEEGAKRVESALTAARTAGEADLCNKAADWLLDAGYSMHAVNGIRALASQPTGQGET